MFTFYNVILLESFSTRYLMNNPLLNEKIMHEKLFAIGIRMILTCLSN